MLIAKGQQGKSAEADTEQKTEGTEAVCRKQKTGSKRHMGLLAKADKTG